MKISRYCLSLLLLMSLQIHAADHAVILLYHHVSESTPPSTSVTPAQFEQHLDYLQENNYRVLPLEQLLNNLYSGEPLPDRAVAITFDDAYISVFNEAAPRLEKLGWPFTVFLASQPLDQKLHGYMSWEDMRKLLKMGGDVGGHSHTHNYLVRPNPDENSSQRNHRQQQEVDINLQRIEKELGIKPNTFAYPFGEYDDNLKKLLKKRGLYGLAQQSGAVGKVTDPLQIPRFPLATGFADMARFRTAVQSRPLPVIEEHQQGNTYQFTLSDESLKNIGCYAASGIPLKVEQTKVSTYRVELPATQPGRNKINCTAPTNKGPEAFYWHSYLWLGATE